MTKKEAYEKYAAVAKERAAPYDALYQSYERNGLWYLRGYHLGTVATVNAKTGEVN